MLKRFGICLAPVLAMMSCESPALVQYEPSSNPEYQELIDAVADWGGVESTLQYIDGQYELGEVPIGWVGECGVVNATYDPIQNAIFLCIELVSEIRSEFVQHVQSDEELGVLVANVALFIMFHELGHAMVHLLDLPVTGLEENVVDQLATLTLLGVGDGVQAALDGANWFWLAGQRPRQTPLWDEHALDQQRFYNVICWIYGAMPELRNTLVTDWQLPAQRAERCPAEYDRVARSWQTILEPHLAF